VLLVGAGGTGSAIAIALLEAGVQELVIHDTDESRTARLIELLSELGRGRVTTGPPDPTAATTREQVLDPFPLVVAQSISGHRSAFAKANLS
jgi:shikimate 5-dehydrogenase